LRLLLPLSLAGLAALLAFAIAGAGVAFARQGVHPAGSSTGALRSAADRYRQLTWTYERAAHVPVTPTSFSYRRSTDPSYLQWTIDTWTRRAYQAQNAALARIHRTLDVRLPGAPALHASLQRRLAFSRAVTLRLRRIYPGTVSPRFADGHGSTARSTLQLWQERSARAALLVASHASVQPQVPAFLADAFTCIHRYEGAWDANTGNGYYGGLQMDIGFQSTYGGAYLRRWGTADHWPVWAQLEAAARAYQSGRGFGPWPNTARMCGLI
jgi:hypothetical protein